MKRLISIMMTVIMGMSSKGAQESIPVNVREYTREVGRNLRALPKVTREAWLAQRRELLFCEDGSSPHTGRSGSEKVTIRRGGKVETRRNYFKEVRREAVFIGSDGQVYNFRAICDQHGKDVRRAEKWKAAGFYAGLVGPETALTAFAQEVRELEVQQGRYFLKQMSPELRAALFAEMLGLLYLEDGQDAYTGRTLYSTIGGERVPYPEYRDGAKFVDTQGKVYSIAQVRAQGNERERAWRTWWFGAKLAMHRVGQDAIFEPFMAEIQAMREQAKNKKETCT